MPDQNPGARDVHNGTSAIRDEMIYDVRLRQEILDHLHKRARDEARRILVLALNARETANACESEGIMRMAAAKRRQADKLEESGKAWAEVAEACREAERRAKGAVAQEILDHLHQEGRRQARGELGAGTHCPHGKPYSMRCDQLDCR